MTNYSAVENKLCKLRDEMTSRISAIDKDVHHREEPVEKDFAEQITQGENDDVLNALDDEARATLQNINAALLRIKEGTYGICGRCGKPIDQKRLEVIPYATVCVGCAE